ncbi:MAG TPA: hypothetical protein VFB00_04390 [Terriglobales bacterium]|nr:hypothetical protein [Terriglobales bacterium]
MGGFFTRERFSTPQFLAGLLLLVFMGECFWLVAHLSSSAIAANEMVRVQEGLAQWRGKGIAGTALSAVGPANWADPGNATRSPLWYLIESAPLALLRVSPQSPAWICLSRAPYILIGALLGASLWYVSRRLYGNAGGYVALTLYCFSPTVIRSSALWFAEPNLPGAWGTFGAVFTAIAVSHTLYAPREVILWNWRRIVLLAVSLALAVGTHFGLIVVLPLLPLFMLYLAPARKVAALLILFAACLIAAVLLLAAYFFHAGLFWQALAQARFLDVSVRAPGMSGAYLQVAKEVAAFGPVLAALAPAALLTYAVWPRTRYFGNTAPLLASLLLLELRVASPHEVESVFSLAGTIFLLVFVAGIAADLLESRRRDLCLAIVTALLAANALWNLKGLAGIAS